MKPMRSETVWAVLERARAEGRDVLLETEGLALLREIGLDVPAHVFVRSSVEVPKSDLRPLTGNRVVVKVISPEILHKTEVGGVHIVPNNPDSITANIREMEARFHDKNVIGYTVNQFVAYDPSLGNELLIGMRWTEDFGPIVTFGPGGIYAEFLSANLRVGKSVAMLSPQLTESTRVDEAIGDLTVTQVLCGGLRGQKPRLPRPMIIDVLLRFLQVACEFMPEGILEFEVNPFVVSAGRLVALDVLLKLPVHERKPLPAARPIGKLRNLLEPESAAIIGVSGKMNPGHIILKNLLREGFPADRIAVIKPAAETIDGCRCYPTIAALPGKVDLFVLAIAATQVPDILTELIENHKAESVIVIPGGLEEKEGGAQHTERARTALAHARQSAWQGPVINGGNCVGIQSVPGRYDTTFIPRYKLGDSERVTELPVAIISQSGAFSISMATKLAGIRPRYIISIGNQMDLTMGDYLQYLQDDTEVELFAAYVEGFKPLDGTRFLRAAREISRSGRTVLLYRAGRTVEGARAMASHTASIAGDYAITRQLARAAGVVLADSIDDFEDFIKTFALLRGKSVGGTRLGALSNAGYECVAMADNLGNLDLMRFGSETARRLREIFGSVHIDQLVDVHNPLDLTPIADDLAYEAAFRTIMEDPAVDVGLLGITPMTPALNTLPRGTDHAEDFLSDTSIAARAIRMQREIGKAWVAVVDAGPSYDPMARKLEREGVPTFRTADRALLLLNMLCAERLRAARTHC
jgi:acyl-CoA synthetase (NDP forming)